MLTRPMEPWYLISIIAFIIGAIYGGYCGYQKPVIIPDPNDDVYKGMNAGAEAEANRNPSARTLVKGMLYQAWLGGSIIGVVTFFFQYNWFNS